MSDVKSTAVSIVRLRTMEALRCQSGKQCHMYWAENHIVMQRHRLSCLLEVVLLPIVASSSVYFLS
jgi:hypothetical protein